MRVLVTGASGFVGAHAVAAMQAEGHQVRAFVRSPDKLRHALEPVGVEVDDVVAGDVTDRSAVEGAVAGCDAVVHAANIYSYDTRLAADMWRVNVSGTDLVLDAALAAGCDPVIHVSSMVVLLPCEGPIPSDPHLPHAKSRDPYVDSKKAAEAVARRRQARGEPVVTVYLGSVWGPHDPGAGEMVKIARLFLNSPVPFGLPGSIGIVDVRAAGRLLSSLLEAGRGPRRILFGGRTLRWKELGRMVIDAAGARPRPFLYTPYPVAVVTGRVFQAISRGTGRESLIHAGGPWVVRHWQPSDDSEAIAMIGSVPPVEETITEATRWMVESGLVKGAQPVGPNG